ncbi:Hypothetical protein SMAX5B_017000 [Scophthalmus maximus]|uniref:Uncharacterized protein n=1 Tax=Scophthalmus maximus TaxID=52904 RepID=A0A2U9B9P7_SCOMX|nr:Hypothetical protein SMAX5B_017000 [Scophthalmus maximus]
MERNRTETTEDKRCSPVRRDAIAIRQLHTPGGIRRGLRSQTYFRPCTVCVRHSVSATETLRRAVEHALDMIPRHASRGGGHIHLSARLTDGSKGRRADTERGQ